MYTQNGLGKLSPVLTSIQITETGYTMSTTVLHRTLNCQLNSEKAYKNN